MSRAILEGMARALNAKLDGHDHADVSLYPEDLFAAQAVLRWLAQNVTDEMVKEFMNTIHAHHSDALHREFGPREGIRSALLEAAGDE